VAVGMVGIAVVAVVAAYHLNRDYWWMTIPFVVGACVTIMLWLGWNRDRGRRGMVIFVLWVGAVGLWMWIEESEDVIMSQVGARQFAARVEKIGVVSGEIGTYGFNDPTLLFYLDGEVPEFGSAEEIVRVVDESEKGEFLLIAGVSAWDRLVKGNPVVAERLSVVEKALASRNRMVYILQSR